MIILFTDFGREGPYTGQVVAVLRQAAPHVDVIDLFSDAPARDPKSSSYLLAAYVSEFPPGTVFLCVVDPGVGSDRLPIIVEADGRWFVGPDNGLFEVVIRRAVRPPRCWQITWRPDRLSRSFHGRDLFAPVAAELARGGAPLGVVHSVDKVRRPDWPDDLSAVVYIDGYGNCMTGVRSKVVMSDAALEIGNRCLRRAETFSSVSPGSLFWYENANGLVEVAENMGNAACTASVGIGSLVRVRIDCSK